MQFITRLTSNTKRALWVAFFACAAVSALAAHILTAEHQINGNIVLKLCKKNANGGWDIIDQTRGTVSFTATTTDALNGQINTNHVWNFRGDKGTQGEVRLKGPGRFNLDTNSGLLTFDLPFEVALKNGKRIARNVPLTTNSLSTPIGQLSGKKAVVDGTTVTAGLIGFTQFPARDLVDESKKEPGKIAVPGVVGGGAGLNNQDLVVTLEIDAKAKW